MCQYCLTSPCLAGCPNEDEPEAKTDCKYCGDGIFKEDEYAEIEGVCYHIDCLSDMGIKELLELLGVEVKVADEQEHDYED